jgi:hypothetical protein
MLPRTLKPVAQRDNISGRPRVDTSALPGSIVAAVQMPSESRRRGDDGGATFYGLLKIYFFYINYNYLLVFLN